MIALIFALLSLPNMTLAQTSGPLEPSLKECESVLKAGSTAMEGIFGAMIDGKKQVAAAKSAKLSYRDACSYWQSHKQDPAAIKQLASSRDIMGNAARLANEKLEEVKKRITAASPHVTELGFAECKVNLVEALHSSIPEQKNQLPQAGDYLCQ